VPDRDRIRDAQHRLLSRLDAEVFAAEVAERHGLDDSELAVVEEFLTSALSPDDPSRLLRLRAALDMISVELARQPDPSVPVGRPDGSLSPSERAVFDELAARWQSQ
jgi:hypothetical protein